VDDLADLFNYVNIEKVMKEFDKIDHDPIIHFYETFLAEYDPILRKSRGVWYTPKPVVQFIVQAVDDILKQEFEIPQGLADASNVKLKQQVKQKDGSIKEEEKVYHKVQILDPATGTGTFLAEVVRNIYQHFKDQQGMWNSYAAKHLIPRINGFEILMASYAMAHLKLDMLLKTETGYKPDAHQRLRIFLTNSLDEANKQQQQLPFAE
jgi:predicted helicase